MFFALIIKKENFIMLNAEDTKERIRKLRLKVISDPTDINSTSNTQDVKKTTDLAS